MVKVYGEGRHPQWEAPSPRELRPPRRPYCGPLRMMTRAEWSALPPAEEPGPRLELPVSHLRYTFTGGESCADAEDCIPVVQHLQREALDRGDPDIMYNFMIGDDGVIFEGRGWDYRCTVPDRWVNSPGESLRIAYIGTHGDDLAPVPMRHAGKHLRDWAIYHRLLNKEHEMTPHMAYGDTDPEMAGYLTDSDKEDTVEAGEEQAIEKKEEIDEIEGIDSMIEKEQEIDSIIEEKEEVDSIIDEEIIDVLSNE